MNGSNDCIGIIYGDGDYPKQVVQACLNKRIACCVVFVGETYEEHAQKVPFMRAKLGRIGRAIDFFHEHNVNKIIFAGAVRRPNFKELSFDAKGASWLLKLGKSVFAGDDALLRAVSELLKEEGFKVISGTDLLKDIFVKSGVLSNRHPTEVEWIDIKKGFKIAKAIGNLDIGQSVIVCEGVVLGVECIEGTDALIARCAKLRKRKSGGVLIKTSKPQQDYRLDLPTVGINTLNNLHSQEFCGLAIESGRCIALDKDNLVKRFNDFSMFFVGMDGDCGEK